MKKILFFTAVIGLLLLNQPIASANIIFADNFNTENGGVGILNYSSFAKWSVTGGTVDLIGNTYYDFFPGNGLYVDLDGSTGASGLLATSGTISLTPGLYELSFYLGGSMRGSTETVTVQSNIGSYSQNFTLLSGQDLTLYTHTFNLSSPINATLSFKNLGGDNVGAILDNVQLSAVPEPASLSLLGLGLLGLMRLGKRKS